MKINLIHILGAILIIYATFFYVNSWKGSIKCMEGVKMFHDGGKFIPYLGEQGGFVKC